MSTSRPNCPKCRGMLLYSPPDSTGYDRVYCCNCGWDVRRFNPKSTGETDINADQEQVSVVVPVPVSPISAPKIKPFYELPRHCPVCGRDGLIYTGKRCARCRIRHKNGLDMITGKPLNLPTTSPDVDITPIKEPDMSKATHGTCNHCKRDDVHLPSPGKCSRCYSRMKKGLDVITGEPIPLFRAHDHAPVAHKPAPAPAVPAAPKVSTPITPDFMPVSSVPALNVDLEKVIDSAWQSKRAALIKKISDVENDYDRLMLACDIISDLQTWSPEAGLKKAA